LGFTGAMNTGGNGYLGAAGGDAQLWLIYRDDGGTATFYGGDTSNGVGGGTGTAGAPDTFTITLNGGTGDFSIDDTLGLINRTGTLSAGTLAAITGIGFSDYNSATGSFSNLSLGIVVPEPASLVALLGLCGMGLVSLALRRRRA
jgi:hypothetical protein